MKFGVLVRTLNSQLASCSIHEMLGVQPIWGHVCAPAKGEREGVQSGGMVGEHEASIRMTSIHAWVGHRARELLVHAHRLTQPAAPGRRVLIFPGEAATGSASDLRAVAVARELGRRGWRVTAVPAQLEL